MLYLITIAVDGESFGSVHGDADDMSRELERILAEDAYAGHVTAGPYVWRFAATDVNPTRLTIAYAKESHMGDDWIRRHVRVQDGLGNLVTEFSYVIDGRS